MKEENVHLILWYSRVHLSDFTSHYLALMSSLHQSPLSTWPADALGRRSQPRGRQQVQWPCASWCSPPGPGVPSEEMSTFRILSLKIQPLRYILSSPSHLESKPYNISTCHLIAYSSLASCHPNHFQWVINTGYLPGAIPSYRWIWGQALLAEQRAVSGKWPIFSLSTAKWFPFFLIIFF